LRSELILQKSGTLRSSLVGGEVQTKMVHDQGLISKTEQIGTKSLFKLLSEEGLGLQVGDEVLVLVR